MYSLYNLNSQQAANVSTIPFSPFFTIFLDKYLYANIKIVPLMSNCLYFCFVKSIYICLSLCSPFVLQQRVFCYLFLKEKSCASWVLRQNICLQGNIFINIAWCQLLAKTKLQINKRWMVKCVSQNRNLKKSWLI